MSVRTLELPGLLRFVSVFAIAVSVWVIFKFVGEELTHAYALGNQLTDVADSYSEANGVRAGEGYAREGFTSNSGLPEVSYGTQFDHVGGKYDAGLCASPVHCVYLHYPPGSEYVIGMSTKIFGVGHLFQFRLIPILFGLMAYSFLATSLFRTLGAIKSAFVMWSLTFMPMANNMMHGIEFHSYTSHLVIFEIGLLLRIFLEPNGLTRGRIAGLAVTLFALGWVSFDCVFIGIFAPIVFWLMNPPSERPALRRTLIVTLGVCGSAIVFAYLLHFFQVVRYLGGFSAAFANYKASAIFRTSGPTWVHPPVPGALGIIIYYWFNLLPQKQYLGFQFVAYVAAVIFLLSRRTPSDFAIPSLNVRCTWGAQKGYLESFLVVLLLATGWLIVMQQHSGIHGHFLPRNYFIVMIVGVILTVRSIQVTLLDESSDASDKILI